MKEKKKAPIIHATRIAWVRYERINPRTGRKQTRLVHLWRRRDGTLRLYLGTVRIDIYTIREVCDELEHDGFREVAGGLC